MSHTQQYFVCLFVGRAQFCLGVRKRYIPSSGRVGSGRVVGSSGVRVGLSGRVVGSGRVESADIVKIVHTQQYFVWACAKGTYRRQVESGRVVGSGRRVGLSGRVGSSPT